MRRVHNDNGTTTAPPVSPPASGPSTSARGRKRKSEGQEKQATQEKTSSRRSSTKSASESAANATKAAELQAATIDIDQWYDHQKALQNLVQGYFQPQDPQSLHFIKDAQDHLTAMGKISTDLLQGPYRRSSWK